MMTNSQALAISLAGTAILYGGTYAAVWTLNYFWKLVA